ncbi:MAG: type II toxin-antitoxin system mRNA interferase toxin, RelE/StbE family [Patescibacteria group bacterium]
MNIEFHLEYKKAYKKRISSQPKLVSKSKERIELFRNNPQNPLLKDHALTGTRRGHRSFSITGDIRVIYEQVDDETVRFLDIGSHNQVY